MSDLKGKAVVFGAAVSLLGAGVYLAQSLFGSEEEKAPKKKVVKKKSKKASLVAAAAASVSEASSSTSESRAPMSADAQFSKRLLLASKRLFDGVSNFEEVQESLQNQRANARFSQFKSAAPSIESLLTEIDHRLIEYIRTKLDVQDNEFTTRTRMLVLLFVLLYHACHDNSKKHAVAVAPKIRSDFLICWKLLESNVQHIDILPTDVQYRLVVMASWLAQRLQSGEKLALLVDKTLEGLAAGKLQPLVIPQMCCACAILGRWTEVHRLKILFAQHDPFLLIQRYEDYHFLAKLSLYNTLDLHTMCDLAIEMVNESDLDAVNVSLAASSSSSTEEKIYSTPKPSAVSWRSTQLRAMKIKGNGEIAFRDVPVNPMRPQNLIVTGRIGRTTNISNVPMVLNGIVTSTRMELVGYEMVRARLKEGASVTEDEQAEQSPQSERQLRRERLSLTRVQNGLRNTWKGTYVVTHEEVSAPLMDVENTDQLKAAIEKHRAEEAAAEIAAAAVAAASSDDAPASESDAKKEDISESTSVAKQEAAPLTEEEENEKLLEEMMKIVEKTAVAPTKAKKILLTNVNEVEMEFEPFANTLEADMSIFKDDLQRYLEYLTVPFPAEDEFQAFLAGKRARVKADADAATTAAAAAVAAVESSSSISTSSAAESSSSASTSSAPQETSAVVSESSSAVASSESSSAVVSSESSSADSPLTAAAAPAQSSEADSESTTAAVVASDSSESPSAPSSQ